MQVPADFISRFDLANDPNLAKLSYDINRGSVDKKTEYKKAYIGHVNQGENVKFSYHDNLKPSGDMLLNSTQKEHYANVQNNPKVAEEQLKTHGLKLSIKTEGKFGHIFKEKEEHRDRFKSNKLVDEIYIQKQKWFKEKTVSKDIPMDLYNRHQETFRGKSQDLGKRQNERFDNLKLGLGQDPSRKIINQSNFNNKLQSAPNRENQINYKLSKINQELNTKESPAIEQNQWNGKTTYNRDYSPELKHNSRAKSQTKTELVTHDLLHQLHVQYHHWAN